MLSRLWARLTAPVPPPRRPRGPADSLDRRNALDLAREADRSLARIGHPSMMGRYAARDRISPAAENARAAVAELVRVLDTCPGPSRVYEHDKAPM